MALSPRRRQQYRQSIPGMAFNSSSPKKLRDEVYGQLERPERMERLEKQIQMNRSRESFINSNNEINSNRSNSPNRRMVKSNQKLISNNLISNNNFDLSPSPFTKEMFLEYYAMGRENLSTIECPNSLEGISFLKAPESYYEIRRLNTVEKYMNLPHWDHKNRFDMLLKRMMSLFNCNGAAISLIDSRLQIVKFQHGLGFDQCSRQVSFDSHTILSDNFFLILDASKDWRFKSNPIVKSIPNIRFYLGVPLIALNGQVIGALSIFDSFPRVTVDDSTLRIMQKMSIEICEYLDSPVKKKLSDNTNMMVRDHITSKLLQSTCLPTNSNRIKDDSGSNSSNSSKLLEIYGRATGNNKLNEEIIFEKDGSGTSYKYNSNLKFSKFSCPYDDLIDMNVWKKISKCNNFTKASNLLCEILLNKLKFDCIYITNVKETRNCWINKQYYPISEREIEVENYKFSDKIEWRNSDYDEEEDNGLGSTKMKIVAVSARDVGVEQQLLTGCNLEFHGKAIRSVNGINYQSQDGQVIFHSGFSLPFYRYNNKLVRKKRMKAIYKNERSENLELFFKSNGYLITCLDSELRELDESEIGYAYECAAILRRIFFY